MEAVQALSVADFILNSLEKSPVCLSKSLHESSVVLAFFRTTCPACQLLFPYLERIHDYYPIQRIYGISQDAEATTREFAARYAVEFPVLLDESCYVSEEFGIDVVPTILWVEADMSVGFFSSGFSKKDLNLLGSRIVKRYRQEPIQIAAPDDGAPLIKLGSSSKRPS
jgi:thiol-disulfide isomerase/thioredoxin